jgi:hypothetical protein
VRGPPDRSARAGSSPRVQIVAPPLAGSGSLKYQAVRPLYPLLEATAVSADGSEIVFYDQQVLP